MGSNKCGNLEASNGPKIVKLATLSVLKLALRGSIFLATLQFMLHAFCATSRERKYESETVNAFSSLKTLENAVSRH